MKPLKQFLVLILSLCCWYWADAQCSAAFTYQVSGTSVALKVTSPYLNSTYAWKLDGTSVGGIATADSVYTINGVYAGTHTVCLTVYVPNGSQPCDTSCQTITTTSCGNLSAYWNAPVPTSDTLRGTAYDTVTAAHNIWSFGDGSPDVSGTSATHVYSTAATYTVCLYSYIPNTLCSDSLCRTEVIPAGSNNSCGTASYYSYIIGDTSLLLYSNSTGTDSLDYFDWYVYNSSGSLVNYQVGHSTSFHSPGLPAGTYKACLYLYNPNQQLCDSFCNYLTIVNCSSLNAQWSYTSYSNLSGDSARFNAPTNNPSGSTYAWTFGDGSTSSLPSVTHNYSQPGTYTVCLVVGNPAVTCHDTLCQSVTVGNSCGTLTAYWNDPTPTNDTLHATAYDTVSAAHHIWNFGDGTNGSGTSVTHVYSAPGTYHVCFYAYVPGTACSDSFCRNVVIPTGSNGCGVASFESYILNDSTIRGYSNSTGTNDSSNYVWNIYNSNGALVQSYNTGHTYYFLSSGLPAGQYRVCLDLYNQQHIRCDSFCTYINILSCSALTAQWTHTQHTNSDSITFNGPTPIATGDSTYSWTFGDGSTSSLHSPTHIYAQSGTYTVCLVVGNPALTCHDTLCQSITATAPTCGTLTAYWNSPTPTNDTFRGAAYDTISAAHHIWNFGDGTNGSGTTVTHVYSAPGTYHVCFYAYIPGTTCSDSFCRNVVIPVAPGCGTASFGDYIYGDTCIHAYSNSTGTTDSTVYKWVITSANGGIIQTQRNDTNYIRSVHLSPGVYTVCLYLYNGRDTALCSYTCNTVVVPIVGACGTASFHDTVISSIGGGYISCYAATNSGVDSAAQISWKIWGANGNLVQNFSGVYSFNSATLDTGTYTVCEYIRATDETRICDSLCQTVVVGNPNPCAGLSDVFTYNFQSNTSDSIEVHGPNDPAGTSYYWTFGDGTYATGQNVTHGYAQAGTYTVRLVVYLPNTNCRDTSYQTVVITTTTPCPVAAFNQYILSDSLIHAYSSSTGTTSSTVYRWSATNSAGVVVASETNTGTTASFLTNALPNGTYDVCLYIYANANSSNICSYVCHTITIADTVNPCAGLNAGFTETHLSNGNVQFFPSDTASGVTHYWHFGDGTVSTSNDPVHAYATPGLYHVCQYVYYAGATCLDSFCTNVQANASGCNANFTSTGYYPPYNGVLFTSTSTSNDSIISYHWSFGDNTVASFNSGDHVFPHSGYWYVCLTIATANGCSSTTCDSVFVNYDPCYGLSSSYTYTYTQSGGVHFAASTNITNAANYWTFGDGTTSASSDPVHYYTQAGTYTVCHIINIPGTLCSDTTCESIQGTGVGTGCTANFTDTVYSNTGNTLLFKNTSTSTDSIVSHVWSFGDGSSSTGNDVTHTFATSGTYYVCLTITAANGCTNTYCDSVHVGHVSTACHASFIYTVDSCQVITFTSTSTGSLEFLRWIYGDGTTDTLSHPTHVYAQGGYYTVVLHFYGNGCYNFDTAVIYVPSCASVGDTVCGNVFNDLNGNGVQNTNEPGIPNAEVHVGSYVTHTDSTGHYVIVVPAGTYTIYYCAPAGYSFTIPVHTPLDTNNTSICAAYQNITISRGSNCGYNFGIQQNTVTICGTVYFDANDNHVQDQNESGIPNAQVIFTSSGGQVVYTAYTDQYGHYCVVLGTGTYVITVGHDNYTNGVVTPGSITVNATTAGGSYDNNNFGVYVAPDVCDLSINVIPNTTVTPGYPAWYELEVCNVGSNVTSGTVNLFYDQGLRYNYSSPAASSQNPTTYTASWNLTGLNPGTCQYYYVSFTADSTLVAGQFIFTLASVTTDSCIDANQSNNVDTVHQNVTASWDPNNKQVSPAGNGPEGLIYNNQWLTYTINFQNTGTAPAVNIVIQDTLSQFLDLTTFKMLGASLPYTMQFAGYEAIWKFNAVSLPDSSTDQQGSHGYVSFMILPLQNLPTKTQITNQADIFFDYNAGMSTNRTLNTIDYPLSVNKIAANNVTITLQPNPFSQYTSIKIDGAEGPYQLNVYDMLGREVKEQTASGNIFDVERGSLASGMYMYEILQQGKVIGKGKMIAQ